MKNLLVLIFLLVAFQLSAQQLRTPNAVNRSAYLMPVASHFFANEEPLHILDIGTSSGLTLNFDRYAYDYGDYGRFGSSAVKIQSEIVSGGLPPFKDMIRIGRRKQVQLLDTTNGHANWIKWKPFWEKA